MGNRGRFAHVPRAYPLHPFGGALGDPWLQSSREPGLAEGLYQPAGRHATNIVRCWEVRGEFGIHPNQTIEPLDNLERSSLEILKQKDVELVWGKDVEVARQLTVVAPDPHPVRIRL